MTINGQFYFSESHEWISKEADNIFYLGISDFAQSELGDIIYITLPDVGKTYQKGEKIGEIESVKSVSEIYAPVTLKILSVNFNLNDSSELINTDPYGSGYIARVETVGRPDALGLMDKNTYESFVSSSHA